MGWASCLPYLYITIFTLFSCTYLLDQLKTLELAELQQLNQAIQDYLTLKEDAAKRMGAFHQALLTSGLVRQIKKPSQERLNQRRLIHVEGKPVSETIIEERR
ncbi:hypothetical protein [Microseira wollei]|uniref:Transposase n=1 Tax=Microseira wollei NIES-4236 TaxID=2530354 RepID=A0AAV3XP17_9CYAN|nr:hypothetical protein [Microseira wollei]GET44088.1 hypothetical protein MiSe_89140 [Microseira wollei NIES-4236]